MCLKYSLLFCLLLTCGVAAGQDTDSLFSRLRGISSNNTNFYNVDGFEITQQSAEGDFSAKTITKKFKLYPVKQKDLTITDSLLGLPNFYVTRSENISKDAVQYSNYYFVAPPGKGLMAIGFASVNKTDRAFERQFVQLLVNNRIPASVYASPAIDSIESAGRKIALGNVCNWMGVNNVQCPYRGQMNWSVHKTLADAILSVNSQYTVIKEKKGGKMIAEEIVDVVFEGTPAKATKVTYDFKGVKSLLVGMSGGKTLTIYFVAAPVRGYFVSCVMSFWNNDYNAKNGLAPLPAEVMQLKQ